MDLLTAAGSAYVSLLLFVRFLYQRERREDKEEIRELKHLLGRSVGADARRRAGDPLAGGAHRAGAGE